MISPLSNNNYYNQYNTLQTAQAASSISMAQQQSALSPASTGTPDVKNKQKIGTEGCQTCKARTYKDQSSDASVSFQTPTHVSPDMAASAVAAHEQEHVQNNAQQAQREGMKATSFVQISTSICPECGRIYVSGGTTTTYYSEKQQPQGEDGTGLFVNAKA